MNDSDGVILVDKPAGVSSHDVVAQVRKRYERGVKVGHAGTLDPFATGLLLVLVGRATRTQQFLMPLRKQYTTIAQLGFTSTTGDPEGELVETGRIPADPPPLPTGTFMQRPPDYSAVKVGGVRAYRIARRGEQPEIAEREVNVARFEQLWRDGNRAEFKIECSAGTYVRALIADLGDAYCETLRRTAIGDFHVDQADHERMIPLNDALYFLPELTLQERDARYAGYGAALPFDQLAPAKGEPRFSDRFVRLSDEDGLIAIAEPRERDGRRELKPVVGFRA